MVQIVIMSCILVLIAGGQGIHVRIVEQRVIAVAPREFLRKREKGVQGGYYGEKKRRVGCGT